MADERPHREPAPLTGSVAWLVERDALRVECERLTRERDALFAAVLYRTRGGLWRPRRVIMPSSRLGFDGWETEAEARAGLVEIGAERIESEAKL